MESTKRGELWAATMPGHGDGKHRQAHEDSHAKIGPVAPRTRDEQEDFEAQYLAPGATRASGSGDREREEEPDPNRTCFERDLDRIKHSKPWRRLQGKTQVFIFPQDHQRNRMTHAIEVAQIAIGIARPLKLNLSLVEAIALGHDCGHGPGGHASEDALDEFVPGGFDHAVWGADVTLLPLNLCAQTLDGVRNHSWSRPAPKTPEGEVVSWADRIAYVCHDFEDAVNGGLVSPAELPDHVRGICGEARSVQLDAFISSVQRTAFETGNIAMEEDAAQALQEFRAFNYERIYMRPESVQQSEIVIKMLRDLTGAFIDEPALMRGLPPEMELARGASESVLVAVNYVSGMTDVYACAFAEKILGWDREELPGYVVKNTSLTVPEV